MKLNVHQFNAYVDGLTNSDPEVRRIAVSSLVKYNSADWENAPQAVAGAVRALVGTSGRRTGPGSDRQFRIEAIKVLGNISTHSPAVVPELLRLLRDDADVEVRTEAARALGKIGAGASVASRTLLTVLGRSSEEPLLRGEAARALASVDPLAPRTTAALHTAAKDRSGYVSVCAAEALWRASCEAGRAVPALAARLADRGVRGAAAQALYRIGPKAKAAVPALLAAAKDKDRLFHESVVMALRKIDPQAAAEVGLA
jgi:HEAT repeat protein